MPLRPSRKGRAGVENQYRRSVTRDGKPPGAGAPRPGLRAVRSGVARPWASSPGAASGSGRNSRRTTPRRKFDVGAITAVEPEICIAGEILQGLKKPHACEAFGTLCTPNARLGAPMVSSEGACAAYFNAGGAGERRAAEAGLPASPPARLPGASLRLSPRLLAHGGGGKLTQRLIEQLFVPSFDNPALRELHDGRC